MGISGFRMETKFYFNIFQSGCSVQKIHFVHDDMMSLEHLKKIKPVDY